MKTVFCHSSVLVRYETNIGVKRSELDDDIWMARGLDAVAACATTLASRPDLVSILRSLFSWPVSLRFKLRAQGRLSESVQCLDPLRLVQIFQGAPWRGVSTTWKRAQRLSGSRSRPTRPHVAMVPGDLLFACPCEGAVRNLLRTIGGEAAKKALQILGSFVPFAL